MSDEPQPDIEEPEPIVVPSALDGDRVDRAVAFATGWSRADVVTLIDAQLVLVDGKPVAKSHKLREGAVIEVLGAPEVDAPPAAEASVAAVIRAVRPFTT